MIQSEQSWDTIDDWWARYVEAQAAGLVELRDVFQEISHCWESSQCMFDTDPLALDWSPKIHQAGPLRANQEENWSRWLAQLFRDSSGPFNSEMFYSRFDAGPDGVWCERAFHDEELPDRRIDIIIEFGGQGVTIEIKIGDEQYEKTPQSAYLTEKHYERDVDWSHYLLLPESQKEALQRVFGNRLEDRARRPVISANGPVERDVAVLYWSDIAYALRRTLLNSLESSDHWCASAYLFTTLIEQRIERFYPRSTVDRFQTDSPGITDVQRIRTIEPDEQLTYLEDVIEEVPHG